MVGFTYNDGGREAAGFKGQAGDCVTRAIAIAADLPYKDVYERLWELDRERCERKGAKARGPRNGTAMDTFKPYLEQELGWVWTPTMQVAQGCTTHLRADELPGGNIIVRVSKHIAAVIDGTLHDTHDCSRDGTRCVYGYWQSAH